MGIFDTVDDRTIRRLLKIRKRNKRKFRRHMAWRWKKLDDNWRYPNGRDNKLRLQYKGYPPKVKVGFRSPKKVRYFHPSGKKEILVHRAEDLFNIDPLQYVVRIAGTVGRKKRLEIVKFAELFGIKILNPGVISPVRATPAIREEEILSAREELETELEKEISTLEKEEATTETEAEASEKTEFENLESELEKELESVSDSE